MTGQASDGDGAGTAPAPIGRIVLAFPADKPTDPTVIVEHVTPGQVFLAAYLLDLIAHEIRMGQMVQGVGGHRGLELPGSDAIAQVVRDLTARGLT